MPMARHCTFMHLPGQIEYTGNDQREQTAVRVATYDIVEFVQNIGSISSGILFTSMVSTPPKGQATC